MTPISALIRQADSRPDQAAFISGNDVWTYRRLADEAERLARGLQARGVRAGDRVVLHMYNLPEMAVAYYACFRLGAIAAPMNTRFKTAELRALLQRLQPALYIGQAQLYPQVAAIEPSILAADARFVVGGPVGDDRAQPLASLFEDTGAEGAGKGSILREPPVDAPAVLLCTSGTTGVPKFVTHTPATLSAVAYGVGRFELDEDHIVINTVPMVHASGVFTFLGCVRFGVSMILLERFDPEAVLDAIESYRGSWMIGLPFMFAELARSQRQRPRRVDSLRFCVSGGDVCPIDLQHDFPQLFGVPLRSFWGSTEAGAALTYGLQPGPVSRSNPGAEVRIVDDAGAPLPHGQPGELQVRSPAVTIGYWAGPGRVDDATVNGGWFPTGDIMRQGDGDEIWFLSRKKDLIIRGGSNISPVEVERVLRAHPAVRDAAVVGVPDEVLGQRVGALIELASNVRRSALDDILASTRAQLADYKVPERLKIVGEIPRNALGKIERKLLLSLLEAEVEELAAAR
jgi:acyl-CoA synthetase (AMP-forming)/AMP-acid ligase II